MSNTNNVISKQQARLIATTVASDIHAFAIAHQEEYTKFLGAFDSDAKAAAASAYETFREVSECSPHAGRCSASERRATSSNLDAPQVA